MSVKLWGYVVSAERDGTLRANREEPGPLGQRCGITWWRPPAKLTAQLQAAFYRWNTLYRLEESDISGWNTEDTRQ